MKLKIKNQIEKENWNRKRKLKSKEKNEIKNVKMKILIIQSKNVNFIIWNNWSFNETFYHQWTKLNFNSLIKSNYRVSSIEFNELTIFAWTVPY